jgi:hypothetical protein
MFIMVMENRVKAGGFGGSTLEGVMREGQVARSKGADILNAFEINKKRPDGLGNLADVDLAVATVLQWSAGGANNGVNNLRQSISLSFAGEGLRADDTKILYWKATVQKGKLRPWAKGEDIVRVGRTDFGYKN